MKAIFRTAGFQGMQDMLGKVRHYIAKQHMIDPGDFILAGVSGGADSVCLFFLLLKLREELSFELAAVHINHHLRETAGRDEQFVRQLCEENQIPFFVKHVDAVLLAKDGGLSVEEAARIARYRAFDEQAAALRKSEGRTVRLALAHHENDQAETVLFHLFRGSSLKGLRGMKPVRAQGDTAVIRPLLCAGRPEIEAYVRQQGLSYVTDETNADNRYARNRIRNELLPVARLLCPEADSHIAQAASEIGRLEEYLDGILAAEYEAVVRRVLVSDLCAPGDADCRPERTALLRIDAAAFSQKHSYVQGELLYRAVSELAGKHQDITRRHIESVLALFGRQVGKRVDLPYGIRARRVYDAVELSAGQEHPDKDEEDRQPEWEKGLVTEGVTCLPDGARLLARVFSYKKIMKIPQNKYTKWFDYDKIRQCPVVRARRASDYFYIDDTHKKTVKAYMIDEKIRKEERDQLCLICEGQHMLWMPGYRISAYYKISQETRNVLELKYIGGTNDGGEHQCPDL